MAARLVSSMYTILQVRGCCSRYFLTVFLDSPTSMARKEQSFTGKIMTDLVHEVRFVGAEAAPGGPKFEQNNFPFDGVVGELFAGRGGGIESGRRLLVLGFSHQTESGEE